MVLGVPNGLGHVHPWHPTDHCTLAQPCSNQRDQHSHPHSQPAPLIATSSSICASIVHKHTCNLHPPFLIACIHVPRSTRIHLTSPARDPSILNRNCHRITQFPTIAKEFHGNVVSKNIQRVIQARSTHLITIWSGGWWASQLHDGGHEKKRIAQHHLTLCPLSPWPW